MTMVLSECSKSATSAKRNKILSTAILASIIFIIELVFNPGKGNHIGFLFFFFRKKAIFCFKKKREGVQRCMIIYLNQLKNSKEIIQVSAKDTIFSVLESNIHIPGKTTVCEAFLSSRILDYNFVYLFFASYYSLHGRLIQNV